MQARWLHLTEGRSAVLCSLCVHSCSIVPGKYGRCGVRGFDAEKGAISPYLGLFSSVAIDPIEKKPLYHWQPGTRIFSLGSIGCTMRCPFCQNHTIAYQEAGVRLRRITPETLCAYVREHGLLSVAYTYNEPALQAEYILDAAPVLREYGIATVLVTNGMMAGEACKELAAVTVAANIDIKSFSDKAYARIGGNLERAKATVDTFLQAGVHVELTTLVVPGISDNEEEFMREVDWIASLSPSIPLHISRYFPAHTYTEPATEKKMLLHFSALAKSRLSHVYLGNVR